MKRTQKNLLEAVVAEIEAGTFWGEELAEILRGIEKRLTNIEDELKG